MLFTTWAIGYLWWHFGQLLDNNGADTGSTKISTDDEEPWYFAWVSSDMSAIAARPQSLLGVCRAQELPPAWLKTLLDVPQYTEIHRIQANHQLEETLYRMGYREK